MKACRLCGVSGKRRSVRIRRTWTSEKDVGGATSPSSERPNAGRSAIISMRIRLPLLARSASALSDAAATNRAVADALRAGDVTNRPCDSRAGRPCARDKEHG